MNPGEEVEVKSAKVKGGKVEQFRSSPARRCITSFGPLLHLICSGGNKRPRRSSWSGGGVTPGTAKAESGKLKAEMPEGRDIPSGFKSQVSSFFFTPSALPSFPSLAALAGCSQACAV